MLFCFLVDCLPTCITSFHEGLRSSCSRLFFFPPFVPTHPPPLSPKQFQGLGNLNQERRSVYHKLLAIIPSLWSIATEPTYYLLTGGKYVRTHARTRYPFIFFLDPAPCLTIEVWQHFSTHSLLRSLIAFPIFFGVCTNRIQTRL